MFEWKPILLIEDNNLFQEIMSKIFKNVFETDCYESVDEFYEKYRSVYNDIIIMDVLIKGGNTGWI